MKQKSLAEIFYGYRIDANHTQAQVADHLGYATPQFISNWERGVSTPPINAIKKLSALYKVDAESIFKLIEEQTIKEVRHNFEKKYHGE